ncbi:CHAT domain-containing protein [Mycena pura]|uniref:CHAT domain-containing protein n=1 Tax=Mycena pura TaxID=153505 RepID=A0AAD6XWX4_9AGAR|nr:CHAT domain-containing protein [Mycena pura]
MERTATESSPALISVTDRESVGPETGEIVSGTSPGKEPEDKKKLLSIANQTLQAEDKGDTMNENIEDNKNNSSLKVVGVETSAENEAMDCFTRAHNLFAEVKAAANISSLNSAIDLLECAASGYSSADLSLAEVTKHLTRAFLTRFIYTGSTQDVQKIMLLSDGRLQVSSGSARALLQYTEDCNHEDVNIEDMMTRAVLLLADFLHALDLKILENAILLYRKASKPISESYIERWKILWELSAALLLQFHLTGHLAQVDEAVSCLRQVQQTKPNRSICLVAALMTGHQGLIGVLHQKEGMALQLEVIQNDQKAVDLMKLGRDHLELYEMHQDLINLEAAVKMGQEAESLLSWGHENRASLLNYLAVAFEFRFRLSGDPKDIDEAIVLHREALEIRAAPHPDRTMSLNNLATALEVQFEQQGDRNDLDEAIALYREALEIHVAPHLERSISLDNLASTLQTRFEQQGDLKDLDEIIALHREALDICAAPYADRSNILNKLASAVCTRFEKQGDLKDLDEAITLHREALEICTAPHPDRSMSLNNLANAMQTRFEQKGDAKDLDEAIELHREALEIRAAPHPKRNNSLSNLAIAVQTRFQQRGDPKDLDQAIALHQEALDICTASHADCRISLNNLANAVQARFWHRGDPKDLDKAIELSKEALEINTAPYPDRSSFLNNLANALITRFQRRGDPKDLDEAIGLHKEALEICVAPHPDRSNSLNNLANGVCTRFQLRGDAKDLNEAIDLHREALEIRIAPHPDRSASLNSLANVVHIRFEQQGDPKDLNEAIAMHQEALDIRAAPHPDRSTSLNNLANALCTRFEQHGDPNDLDEAAALHREALEIRVAPHPDRSMSLNNLANALYTRFQQLGDENDLDEAIELHREALEICATPHPARSVSLDNLASSVCTRYEYKGDPKDLEEAIKLYGEALETYGASHHRSKTLNNLASALKTRFEQQGDHTDLNKAISLHQEALTIHPHSDRRIFLSSLANAVQTQFELLGDPKNLDKVIALHREAVEICVAPHPGRSMSLNSLAIAVQTRFRQRGDMKDLDEAIKLNQEALEIRAAPHPKRISSLNNLSNAVFARFQQSGDTNDLDEAIKLSREALKICATSHPNRSTSLNNLANAVCTRFEQKRDPKDLDEAIELHRKALEIHAAPNPARSKSLNNLAKVLRTQFEQQGDPKDLDEAIELYREVLQICATPHLGRANEWVNIATQHSHGSCLPAYQATIKLLPQLVAFHLDLKSRQVMLTRAELTSLAAASANCAIGLHHNKLAVEFLEASRSVFWAQALHLRTPLDKLADVDPTLASKLQDISRKLEKASFRDTSRNVLTDTQHQLMSIEAMAVQSRHLSEEWDKTLDAIRKVAGFEDFLQPRSIASLRQAAASGPIVILLASDSICSALIVKSTGDVQHVELPALNVQILKLQCYPLLRCSYQSDLVARLYGAEERYINMSPDDIFCRLLADIWHTIVKPVFEKSKDPSRLWWCPIGIFAFIPIHAAGVYNTDKTDCVSDYIISSYTPTLTALLDPPAHTTGFFKMMAVIEPHAPGYSALPGTVIELDNIKNRVPSQWLIPLERTTQDTVMHHLHSSSVVHFACHGTQNLANPLHSGLILSDGSLKVSRIMRTPEGDSTADNMKNMMKLAFLSACETAKGDANIPDEAMHLGATLLFAGFRGVVATMWTMNDHDGPKIADAFYANLFKDCNPNSVPPILPDLSKAARALHFAVAQLRKEPGMTFQRWVPFVHYGL